MGTIRISALLLSLFVFLVASTMLLAQQLPIPANHCLAEIDRHPQAAIIYVAIGDAYAQLGDEAPALANYHCAIRIKPQDSSLYYNLARLLANRES